MLLAECLVFYSHSECHYPECHYGKSRGALNSAYYLEHRIPGKSVH